MAKTPQDWREKLCLVLGLSRVGTTAVPTAVYRRRRYLLTISNLTIPSGCCLTGFYFHPRTL